MNERSREHGAIAEHSVRTVGMDPILARQVVREEEDLRYPLLATSLEPPRVSVTVSDAAIGTLDNGLGANWSPPGQGEEAFPDDADEAGWKRLFTDMTAAGIRWVRFWLPPQGVVKDGNVDAAHRLLKRLDRLQAWAAATDSGIVLELSHVPEEYRYSPVYDAPANNERYAKTYIVPLMLHVMKERRCDRVRQLCLFDEPFNPDVAPYIFAPKPPKDPLIHYLELHEILRAKLDRLGLERLALIGPNSANLFQRHIQMFEDQGLGPRVAKAFGELDVHVWRLRFDYYPASKRWPGYGITEGIERYLKPTLAAARRMGKRLSVTEAGAMYFNEHPCTSRTTRHDAFLTMAEGIVRCVNEGVAGAMVWSFTSSGRIDGQWGWIGTRDRGFERVPNLYNGFACLMRHQRIGAAIHPCSVARSDYSPFISAGALAVPGEGETIWLINDHPVENIAVSMALPEQRTRRTWTVYRKDFDPQIKTVGAFVDADRLGLVLPGMSLTTLTT